MDGNASGNFDAQAAFADAVARARQIAAKINQPGADGSGESLTPQKRPFDQDSQPFAIGAQLKALSDQGNNRSQSVLAAQEAAARINQQLGISSPGSPPISAPIQKPGPHAGLGMVVTEEFYIPDKMVGLVIGKGGEQITRLQAETGCKIQIAPDSGGMPDRSCSLTGSASSVSECKAAISSIIDRGQSMGGMDMGGGGGGGIGGGGGGGGGGGMMGGEGQAVLEMMIPGGKVGLVIGKGGETIKQLQERAGVKMVMIQDSNVPSSSDKPLRITGEQSKCQRAKEMVMDLLTEKELESMQRGGYMGEYGSMSSPGGSMEGMQRGGFMGEFGSMSSPGGSLEIPVPRQAVGIVIGKGGDMIKKIQSDTGARVQFKPDDGQSPDRICSIAGPPDKAEAAAGMIQDLLNSANQFGGNQGGMGRGFPGMRGRGGGGRGRGGMTSPGRGGMGRGGGGGFDGFQDETTFAVPADKCGLVIGKGGETIRQINQTSGAHVELQRAPPPNPNEKLFTIRGNPQQIQHAIQLISEKAGLPGGPGGPGGPSGSGPGPSGQSPQGGPTNAGGFEQFGGQYGPQGQQPAPAQYNQQPGGWNNNNYQYQQQPQPAGGETDKQATDNAAAWAAYYAQYYSQYGQQPAQQQPQQQTPPQPQQQQQQAQQQSYQQPNVNPVTGQPDYSAAWAEYYRQQGMHYQANMILQQAGQGTPATASNPGQMTQQPQQ